jgi:hypothetical protein
MNTTHFPITLDPEDERGARLALALGARHARGTTRYHLTAIRARKFRLLHGAGFDTASDTRMVFSRPGGPKLTLSDAVWVAETIERIRAEAQPQHEPARLTA